MRARHGDGPAPGGPVAGEMYKVATEILPHRDAHGDAFRPAVVVSVHADVLQVRVCPRTTQQEDGSGIEHEASFELELDQKGWFRPHRDWGYQPISTSQFTAPLVRRLGMLNENIFARIVEAVEEL